MYNQIIPHSRPTVSGSDLKALVSTLESGQLSQGPKVGEFERKMAAYVGTKAAAATSSGSSALHLALLALDIGKSDEVIIPSYACAALLNSIFVLGATPILVDIDPLTFNISAEAARRAMSRKTRAVIVPHMFGRLAEIDKIQDLGIPVIEDCAQALGAEFRGAKAGSFGRLSVFSFYATKMLSTAEGGMVLSDSETLIDKIKDLRAYDEKEDYALRFNYKMTDLQAALGLSQLALLDKFVKKRRAIASLYFEEFRACDFSLPVRDEGKNHVYYRFVVKTRREASKYIPKLEREKVICRRPVFMPLHLYLRQPGFPESMDAWKRAVSLPLYPSLREKEIEKIVYAVKKIFGLRRAR